ncbi:MAG TPA: hypothetical protein VLY04_00810 [Bryobacteraceae bacterium]|nr:hypothetical protein [Bryobacteraceae bacterium]
MTEEARQHAILLKLTGMGDHKPPAPISTGFPSLDRALALGGLPRSSIVEIFGPASCGKSALALQIVARAQRDNFTCAWVDAEHVFDPAYAASLSVAIDRLPVAMPSSAEEALAVAQSLITSNAVDVLVIDSAAALVPRLELETGFAGGGYSLHARFLASGLRKLARTVARSDTLVVFLNQIRFRTEPGRGQAMTSAGGPPLKLYAALRIELDEPAGRRVRFRVVKNRAAAAFREGQLERQTGGGFLESP